MENQLQLFTDTFRITETGLTVVGKPDFGCWLEYGKALKVLDTTARQFAIGDWIVHGFGCYERGKWESVQEIWGDASVLREYERCAKFVKSANRLADFTNLAHLSYSRSTLASPHISCTDSHLPRS